MIRQVYVGMGNVAYLAPELYTDPAGAGAQADIYATGIMAYNLLTGAYPFKADTPFSRFNMPRASSVDTGASCIDVSLSSSTKIPPSPTTTSGPNKGSIRAPIMTSTPRSSIGCTSTPWIRGAG